MATDKTNADALEELCAIFNNLSVYLHKEKRLDENVGDTDSDENLVNSYFEQLLEKIEGHLNFHENSSPDYVKLLSMKASLLYEKAKLRIVRESSNDALVMLQNTLTLIEEYADHDYIIFLYLRIVNHLSYLLSKEGRLEEARNLLENILYKEYSPSIVVYGTEDLFNADEPDASLSRLKFNKLMLNNVQMLGWIYGKLGFHDLHAFMEHMYLQKQLEIEDLGILHWISKCCRLVIIYLTTNNWIYARYYLASASAVLSEKANNVKSASELSQAKASLCKAWIHYGLHLFSASKKRLLEKMCENDKDQKDEDKPPFEVLDQHKFRSLQVIVPNIPANFVTNTQEARALFIHTQNWLKHIRTFYTLRDYPLQYVNAVLDLSELYRFLAFYETDLESQYNVQKRRSETLEALATLLREVRPSCYTAVCIELWRELAEVQIELMGINLKRLYTYENQQETADNIKKRIVAVSEVHDKLEAIGDIMLQDSPVKEIGKLSVEQ